MDLVELALRIGLTATFLLSAAGKTMSFPASREMVAQLLRLADRRAASGIAGVLILAEGVTAVAIASADGGYRAQLAAGAAGLLCLLFAGAAVLARTSPRPVTCHCFGSLRPAAELGSRTLVRAAVLAAAVVGWIVVARPMSLSADVVAQRAALAFAASALVSSVIAWTHWRQGIPHRRFAIVNMHHHRQEMLARAAAQREAL
ncbi:MAG: MauE/DoxX family redox-associated membrane protein [Micromonosporaceae bacterium]